MIDLRTRDPSAHHFAVRAISICFLLVAGAALGCRSADRIDARERAPSDLRVFGSEEDPITRYLVLGDSTAVGVGGDYEQGIAVSTARHIARDRRVILSNLAVSGAQVTDVRHEQLARVGKLVPDVVLLAVGANDVTHLTTAASLEEDLRAVIDRLVQINPSVEIVLTGAPDMTTPPRIPAVLRGLAGWRTRVLNDVFRRVARERGLTFAPIAARTGPLFASDPTLFSEDEFHPSTAGYDTWTTVLNEALDEALTSSVSATLQDSAGASF